MSTSGFAAHEGAHPRRAQLDSRDPGQGEGSRPRDPFGRHVGTYPYRPRAQIAAVMGTGSESSRCYHRE